MNKKLPLSKTRKFQGKTPEEILFKGQGQVEKSKTVKQVEISKAVEKDLSKDLEKNPLLIDKGETSKNPGKKSIHSKKTQKGQVEASKDPKIKDQNTRKTPRHQEKKSQDSTKTMVDSKDKSKDQEVTSTNIKKASVGHVKRSNPSKKPILEKPNQGEDFIYQYLKKGHEDQKTTSKFIKKVSIDPKKKLQGLEQLSKDSIEKPKKKRSAPLAKKPQNLGEPCIKELSISRGEELKDLNKGLKIPKKGLKIPEKVLTIPKKELKIPTEGLKIPKEGLNIPKEGLKVPDVSIKSVKKTPLGQIKRLQSSEKSHVKILNLHGKEKLKDLKERLQNSNKIYPNQLEKKTQWKNTLSLKLPQQFRVPVKNLWAHKFNNNKKVSQSKNYKRYLYFSNVAGTQVVCPHIWTNQWNNLHLQYKSLLISQLIQKYFLRAGTYVNKIYIHHYHNGLRVLADSLGVFRGHNAGRKIRSYKKKLKYIKTLRRIKSNPTKSRRPKILSPLSNVAKLLMQINKVTYVKLSFYHMYLPIKYMIKNAIEVFKKENRQRFFGESVQLVYRVFKGYASASILGGLIYTYTRKNPKRLRYLAFIKRLVNWHFEVVSKSQIQGVRIEVKGRFNAKSRARKYIISTGRVAIHTVSSNVDTKQTYAITKFGMLGIKVWICPKKKLKKRKNVIITKKNKIQESPKGKNSVYRYQG